MPRHAVLSFMAIIVMMLMPLTVTAQEEPPQGLTITSPYPRVAIEAGDQVNFDLMITAPEPTTVTLATTGVPDGWVATFSGGGFQIDGVTAGPTPPEVSLDVNVPPETAEGTHDFSVTATGDGGSVELLLQVRVSAQAGGEVTLTPDFPGLRAPAGEAVTFNVELSNDTPSDLVFELESSGPAGWDVSAQPATEPQAATIQVDSGATTQISVEATSPPQAESGQYTISVQATSPETEVGAEMIVEIVGSFSLDLTTIDQRLSTEVSADGPSEIELVVTNTGTAPIQSIQMSATPPSGWEATFAESVIAQLGAGQSVTAVATITPSDQAIAGDYVITFSASSDQAQSEVDIRTTVNPSALWGFVGIALIALTLAGLAWVFRRFGRR
ncbi:MAG: NEW3 domain-containing protein [Acidimicrobiia bacterium]